MHTFVFDRAHRLGSEQNTRKPRPVVVKFHRYKEREIVSNKSFQREQVIILDEKTIMIQEK